MELTVSRPCESSINALVRSMNDEAIGKVGLEDLAKDPLNNATPVARAVRPFPNYTP